MWGGSWQTLLLSTKCQALPCSQARGRDVSLDLNGPEGVFQNKVLP